MISIAITIGIGLFFYLNHQSEISLNTNNNNVISIGNQTFYFLSLNKTMMEYHNPTLTQTFHNVTFNLFPHPWSGGPPGACSGTNFEAFAIFQDGMHELISLFIPDQSCPHYIPTALSEHKNPQVGLWNNNGKIILLVS